MAPRTPRPMVLRVAGLLGIAQAVVMIAASLWAVLSTLNPPTHLATGEQPLTVAAIAPLAIAQTAVAGVILIASLRLSRLRPGPRVTLYAAEAVVLFGAVAFIGIAADFTAPLALVVVLCLLGDRGSVTTAPTGSHTL